MKILAGKLEEFPIGAQKSLEFGDDDVLVLRSLSGFWAIEDRCSHNDSPLRDSELEERDEKSPVIKCLWHGAKFDLETGKALSLPAVKAVKTYTVTLEGEEVWVEEK
jgi:3-phenylpropionate/trans-cinnamate dioxygenase ferredoxin component